MVDRIFDKTWATPAAYSVIYHTKRSLCYKNRLDGRYIEDSQWGDESKRVCEAVYVGYKAYHRDNT